MRLAYADPPYFGYGSFYDKHHPESRVWDDLDAHRDLIQRLCDEFDGWALSMTSGQPDDELVDVFPGTGVMDRVVTARSGRAVAPEQLEFSLDGAS